MSRNTMTDTPDYARFPRVSGDEPPSDERALAGALFSPRERG